MQKESCEADILLQLKEKMMHSAEKEQEEIRNKIDVLVRETQV